MSDVKFEVVSFPGNRYAINDNGRTVALVSFEGAIDWLLKSPMEPGPLVTSIVKDVHLAYTRGVRLCLVSPSAGGDGKQMETFKHRLEDGGKRLVLSLDSVSGDGKFAGRVVATLCTDAKVSRYEWHMHAQITNTSGHDLTLPSLEFENIYPGKAGLCFLNEPTKEYRWTLVKDRDGTVWRCPHQHIMHYGKKLEQVNSADGAWAGFFGEPTGSPVVIVDHCDEEPLWGICEMFYDLHSCCKLKAPFKAGRTINYVHRVLYFSPSESEKLVAASKPIPVTEADHQKHDYPRLELGMNKFDRNVNIIGEDDAAAFRTKPPVKVWDREVGCSAKGSLRITNDSQAETAWACLPPSVIPASHKLTLRGMIKTQGVVGKGAFIRIKPYIWAFEPQPPHMEWLKELCSGAVSGTSDGWVKVEVPSISMTKDQFDYLAWIEFVLDGQGVAWLTEVDVDLQPLSQDVPQLEQDSSGKSRKSTTAAGSKSVSSGSAM